MKVKFLGAIDHESEGCSSCGGRKSKKTFVLKKTYSLPSGIINKTFRANVIEEVSDMDGSFLLQSGHFEEV